jgi:hypothetical protein
MPRIFCVFLLVAAAGGPAMAAPAAEAWPRWQAHAPGATATIDHAAWQAFLDRYLVVGADGINRVAYGSVSAEDRRRLADYVAALAAVAVSTYDRPEQLAFWINLYNALTLQVVLDHYPVASIRDIDISPGLFADGPWGEKLTAVEGEPLSLDDIEHRILRPLWRDPRIHYVVNCAALSCPNLQPLAFTGANAEALLERAAREFIAHPRGVRVAGERIYVSRVYDWYAEDFGGEAGVLAHIRRYATPDLNRSLLRVYRRIVMDYDWALNDAGTK